MFRILFVALIGAAMTRAAAGVTEPSETKPGSRVRTYYVAADEVEWDYAPGGCPLDRTRTRAHLCNPGGTGFKGATRPLR
jgi:hypothetical protein